MAYREKLKNGLLLRSVENDRDVERIVEFNTRYNNTAEGETCRCLLNHHPGMAWEDFQLIEDEETGEMISTTCLIPWECQLEGIQLKTAMLEMVLTHPEYRKQGLVRTQIERFSRNLREKGYDLSVIWGIPYYYRQFGYTYCIDGNRQEELPEKCIPERAAADEIFIRKAAGGDIPLLEELYDRNAAAMNFHVARKREYWKYLLNHARYTAHMVEYGSGNPVGYIIYHRGGGEIAVLESSIPDKKAGLAVLQALKKQEDRITGWRISWPEDSTLAETVRSLGSKSGQHGQWLLRITDVPAFLWKIRPVFEKRIAESPVREFSGTIVINLYKEAYRLEFLGGKMIRAENAGFVDTSMGADGGDLCIPPDAFTRLVFGFRTLPELTDAWPDILLKEQQRELLEVLFPRLKSYLHMPFHMQTLS